MEEQVDAKGRKFTVHKLPIPKDPILVTEEDLPGYVYEEGEEERTAGERLAASYVNFYVSNGAVLVPWFDDEHDAHALHLHAAFSNQKKSLAYQPAISCSEVEMFTVSPSKIPLYGAKCP